MVPDLLKTVSNGFNFNQKGNTSVDLALISLKIALESYYSTYQAFKYRLHIFQNPTSPNIDIEFNHSNEYCERSADCIVHFQHFAELACKSLLRNDHPLLADIASGKPEIVHKLLHGQPLTSKEEGGVQSIEFSEALKRLCCLVKNQTLKDHADANFILRHEQCLEQLNKLRNRVWHRGIFILKYTALDEFIGGHVLPFVLDVLKHPSYASHDYLSIPAPPVCAVDPIIAIVDHFKNETYDIGKVALLKELGRASYNDPLSGHRKQDEKVKNWFRVFNSQKRMRAEKIAKLLAQQGDEVKSCPVCGVQSLVVYEEIESFPTSENEETEETFAYTHTATCENCGLDLHASDIKNASDYGITAVEDYWRQAKWP